MEQSCVESLRKKKAGLPARRSRTKCGLKQHAALQMELTAIQETAVFEETTDLPRRNHDGNRIYKDCGRVVVLADLSDF